MQAFLCICAEILAMPVSNIGSSSNAITIMNSNFEWENTAATTNSSDVSVVARINPSCVSYSIKPVIQPRQHEAIATENLKNKSNGEKGAFIGVIGAVKLLAKTLLAARFFTN